MKKSRILGVVTITGLFIGIFIIMSLNTRPFITVSRIVDNPELYDRQEIQVSGVVRNYIGNEFELTEDNDKIRIIPDNIEIPDEVYNGSEVVVQGEFDASGVLLRVNEILTYCCDRSGGVSN